MNEKVKQQLDFLKNGTHSETFLEDHEYDIECALKDIETALNEAEENEKELIAEQHRLFDLAKEQEEELNELKEFARIVSKKQVRIHWLKGACLERYNRDIRYNFEDYASDYMLTQTEFDLVKKVVEKYGK